MPHNLYVHDAKLLCDRVLPLLEGCRRSRSFSALPQLTSLLQIPAADDSLFRAAQDMPFDRQVFQALVGQTLVLGAHTVPDLPLDPETLIALLAPHRLGSGGADRAEFSHAEQLFRGSRDLRLGARPFRPDHIGWNNREDVLRLGAYLTSLDPQSWIAYGLRHLASISTDEDREHELGIVQDWWPELLALLRTAQDSNSVIVCEDLS